MESINFNIRRITTQTFFSVKLQKLNDSAKDGSEGSGPREEGEGYGGSGLKTARSADFPAVISPGVALVSLPVPVTIPAAVPQEEVRQAPEQVSARVQVLDRVVLIHVHLKTKRNRTFK